MNRTKKLPVASRMMGAHTSILALILVGCGSESGAEASADTETTGTPGTDDGASTGAPELVLGPCAQLLPCVEATNAASGAPFDNAEAVEVVYGEDGSCWSDLPAAECWRQCEEAIVMASMVVPDEPACWGCASDDDCEGETPYCSYRHACAPTPDFCADYCGQIDACCPDPFLCDGVSIEDVPSCVEGCEQTLTQADVTPCGSLRRQAMECAAELTCDGYEDWIPAWLSCRNPDASCPGYDDCAEISEAHDACVAEVHPCLDTCDCATDACGDDPAAWCLGLSEQPQACQDAHALLRSCIENSGCDLEGACAYELGLVAEDC